MRGGRGLRGGARRWLALAVAALAFAGCGDDPAGPVGEVFDRARAAVAAGDAGALCGLLSREAKRVIGRAGHNAAPYVCREDVERLLGWVEPYRGGPAPRVEDVYSSGEGMAQAMVRLPGGAHVALPFRRQDGGWRLDGLVAAELSRTQVDISAAGDERLVAIDGPPERSVGGNVAASGATAGGVRRCAAVDTSDFPRLAGGCRVRLAAGAVELSIWTPFGVVAFGSCSIDYRLRLDRSGRGWVEGLTVDGPNPCSDTVPCIDTDHERIPWPAAIRRTRGGGLRVHIERVCLESCVGRYRGDWKGVLYERPDHWRLRLTSMLGTSGWRTDGAVRSPGKSLAIGR